MNWTPNKWIAAVLGLFFQPLGMLYVIRVKWALVYLLGGAFISSLEFYGLLRLHLPWLEYFSFAWLLMFVCAIHAYYIASHWTPVLTRPWYSHWYGLITIPATVFVCIFGFRAFLYEPFRMPAGSMLPTIEIGSIIIAKKSGYGNYGTYGITLFKTQTTASVQRGDIMIFEYPKDPSIDYVKRVIGLPGDVIEYKNKHLFINGEKATTAMLSKKEENEFWEEKIDSITYTVINNNAAPARTFSMSVPPGQYFVLGDNRDNSNDSRYWGFVPQNNLVGKVTYVYH